MDVLTYVFSFSCYMLLRQGRHTVAAHTTHHIDHPVRRFLHEAHEAMTFVNAHRSLAFRGLTWAFFVAAMIVAGVVTAPVSDRILHAGAVGYGWMNSGWGIGAFFTTFCAADVIRRFGSRRIIPISMLILAACFYTVPFSAWIGVVAGLYLIAGAARAVGGVALSSSIMETVPKHFMGRVSTLFSIAAIILQVILAPVVGRIAQSVGLTLAVFMIASLYLLAATSAWISAKTAGVTSETPKFKVTAGH